MSKARPSRNVGESMRLHSIVVPGFSPGRCYGAYAQLDREDLSYQLKVKIASSRSNRKVVVTLPTTPFDWKSDPATSGPTSPSAPDVSAAVAVNTSSATATAATLSTDRR